jgi:hypothetical protein
VRSEQNEAESWEWLGVNRIEQRVGSGWNKAESREWLE